MSDTVVIECEFKDEFWLSCVKYTCKIEDQVFDSTKKYQFDVENCRDVSEVKAVELMGCKMPTIPQNLPWDQFPNLQCLIVFDCNLSTICKEDFRGLSKDNLKELVISNNNLEYLPGDLFDGMENLEKVSFSFNKIKYIEAELIDSLMKLKYLAFSGNTNIDLSYYEDGSSSSLEEIRLDILEKCHVTEEIRLSFKLSKEELAKEVLMLRKQLKIQNDVTREQHKEILALEKDFEHLNDKIKYYRDLLNAFKKDATKDYSIIINDQSFKVHKCLLIARSPVLAEMIESNPEADILKLKDIPLEVFQHILDFIYNDTLPEEGATFEDIFIASGHLKLEKLKNYAGIKLADQVNENNALDMLSLANKFDHEDLRLKAFEVVLGMFPDQELEYEMVKEHGTIQKLLEIKTLQDMMNDRIRNLKIKK